MRGHQWDVTSPEDDPTVHDPRRPSGRRSQQVQAEKQQMQPDDEGPGPRLAGDRRSSRQRLQARRW